MPRSTGAVALPAQSAPAAPAEGVLVYARTGGLFYKGADGVEVGPLGGAAQVAQSLDLTPTTDQGSSVSTGGALNLTNTGQVGAGAVFFSNRGADAAGRLVVVNTANAANTQTALHVQHAGTGDAATLTGSGTGRGLVISAAGGATAGSKHALSVALTGTGSDTSSAATFTSTNAAHSAVQITGVETGRGTVKIAHTGTGTDTTASGLSVDLQGTGTAAQGIFVDATQGGTSGRLLNLRNAGVEQVTVTPSADKATSTLQVTGAVRGSTGVFDGSDRVYSAINPPPAGTVQTGTVGARLLKNGAAQTLQNQTGTQITFGEVQYDQGGYTTTPGRTADTFKVPPGFGGMHVIVAQITFNNDGAPGVGVRAAIVYVNGGLVADVPAPSTTSGFGTTVAAFPALLNDGDVVTVSGWQSSGGPRDVVAAANGITHYTTFSVTRIGGAQGPAGPATDLYVASSATAVPLRARGAAGQTANLQEWQISDGTVRTRVSAGGDVYTSRSLIVGSAADAGYFNGAVSITPTFDTGSGVVVRARAAQTGNLQEWQDSAGAIHSRILSDGSAQLATQGVSRVMIGPTAMSGQLDVSIPSTTPNRQGLMVRGAAGQTANLAEFQNSAGAVVGAVLPDGSTTLKKTWRQTHTWAVSGEVKPADATNYLLPMFISLASGQTAKLIGWRTVIYSGTNVVMSFARNGTEVTGSPSTTVTSSPATKTLTTPITLADADALRPFVNTVSGTPMHLTISAIIEYTA